MKSLTLIGIGTGNPEHLTEQARTAIAKADLILVPDKGEGKSDLSSLRMQLISAIRPLDQTIVSFQMPVRDPELPYQKAVDLWHDEIAGRWTDATQSTSNADNVALLVWGDPSLYDSTLRIAERLDPKPKLQVIPGLTSLQLLTAAHAIPLNMVADAVTITTGRRLADHGWPQGVNTLAVMLDGRCAFQTLEDGAYHIWWGAYVGMDEEVLISGQLSEVCDQIISTRAAERERHGWIMDIYLLRKLKGA